MVFKEHNNLDFSFGLWWLSQPENHPIEFNIRERLTKIISVLGEWNQYATDSSIRLEAIPNCNILFLRSYLVQQEILSFRSQYIKEFSSIQTILCYILNYLIRLCLNVKVLSKGAWPGRWALKSWPSQPGIGSNTTYDTTTRVSLILDGLDHYFRIMPVRHNDCTHQVEDNEGWEQ